MEPEACLRLCILGIVVGTAFSLPEPGFWKDEPVPDDNPYLYFVKNMYKDTIISVEIHCDPKTGEDTKINVEWVLRNSPCSQEYHNFEGNKMTKLLKGPLKGVAEEELTVIEQYIQKPNIQIYKEYTYKTVQYLQFKGEALCSAGQTINLPDLTKKPPENATVQYPPGLEEAGRGEAGAEPQNGTTGDSSLSAGSGQASSKSTKPKQAKTDKSRRKREETSPVEKNPKTSDTSTSTGAGTSMAAHPPDPKKEDQKSEYHVAKVWKSGSYIFIMKLQNEDETPVKAKGFVGLFTVTVRMKSKVGYISAFEWPLLIFYGVMGLMYILYGLVWLVMLACNWRDLLRIQYWIGAVIVLGMLEKAVFFSEYQSIANTGMSVTDGAEVFAEIVSCLKRSLARMLVIIVSLGFGIVKPRLGPAFHKVLFVGGLYFVLATVEGCMRSLRRKGDQSTDLMLAQVPLAVLDAAICWWIFSSLMQTIRQLRLRRNIVKLTLYRHFTNTLIFAVLASIIFMIWSVIQIKRKTCLTDWQEIWIDDAFWHLLFSVLLLVIMILWRPSSNNQRYAFSPLLDAADDEEEDDSVMNDAFDGMKMRTKQVNGSPKQKQTTIEDDLKWVEENIPSAISDKASTLLDSDEEIMTAKYEMSKMQ